MKYCYITLRNPKLYILFFSLLISVSISAQSGGNSPFSRFGIGNTSESGMLYMQQMGGISAAFTDNYHINIVNPASYSFLKATSFDIGVSATNTNLKDNDGNSSRIWSGNLENISLAFPLRNPLNEAFDREKKDYWWGMAFSLNPNSEVAYDIVTQESDPEIGIIERSFDGSGGTYKVFWGNSFKYKNISFGMNLGYLFGQIEYQRNLRFLELNNALNNNFSRKYTMRGFVWNSGVIYSHILNKKAIESKKALYYKKLNFGIYGNSKTSFNTKSNVVNRNFIALPSGTVTDSLLVLTDVEGNGNLPAEIGFGAVYQKGNQLSIGADYKFTNWSQYTNDANPEELANTYRFSVGGYYRPDWVSFKYAKRVFYRFGAFYGTEPQRIESNQLSNYGISLGLGLPFVYQRKISHMNLGLSLGRRGESEFLRENYVKLGISFTFNDDEWFIKRRYN